MTLTNENTTPVDEITAVDPDATSAARPRASLTRRVVAVSAIVVVIVVGIVAVFIAFEGAFANWWYRTRQRALVSDFNAPHPHVGNGHAIAIIQIPRLGVNVAVAEGDTPQQLRGGPGHRANTPLPGVLGNCVIVGHAHDWGGPFAGLRQLRAGDLIAVQSYIADEPQTSVYKVASTATVDANTTAPFATANDYRLTLITGAGHRFSNRRFVVTAISGVPGRLGVVTAATVANTAAGSTWANGAAALALFGLGGASVAFVLLRRRYRVAACLVVVMPLAVVGLLGLLFDLDLLLPPLR
jgi:LPXTG-site transpeptidase (sortase) family protein